MKFIVAAGLTLCLAPSVLSSVIPVPVPVDLSPTLDKRVVPLTPPQGSVTCLGYTVPESDILAAINQGTAWATTTPPTQMGKIAFPSLPFQSNPIQTPLTSPVVGGIQLVLGSIPNGAGTMELRLLIFFHPSPPPPKKNTTNPPPRLLQLPTHLQQLRRHQLPQLRRLDHLGVPRAPLRQQPVGAGQEHEATHGAQRREGAGPGDFRAGQRQHGHVLRHDHARPDQVDECGQIGRVCPVHCLVGMGEWWRRSGCWVDGCDGIV